jgi:hypothetical protein
VRSSQTLAALLALSLLATSGCAYSMVSNGAIRAAAFDELAARTAAIAGGGLPLELESRVIASSEMPAILRELVASEWSAEELAGYEEGLVTIGIWPPELDYVEVSLSLTADQVAGFYVPAWKRLYIVSDVSPPWTLRLLSGLLRRDLMGEIALSHELVHAHQHHSHPILFDELATVKDNDDSVMGAAAAVEGNATHEGFKVVLAGGELDPDVYSESMQLESDAAADEMTGVPAILSMTLIFPYLHGYRLAYAEGKTLLDDPPASTEQVLHDGKRHEPFWAIDLQALREQLPAGCTFVYENTLGELGMSVLLKDLGETPAPSSGEGWNGDRYLAARCGPDRELVWLTYWDSEDDARAFATAYRTIAPAIAKRAALGGTPEALRAGESVVIWTPRLARVAQHAGESARRARVRSQHELRAHALEGSAP